MKELKVSVYMTTYNNAKNLKQALDSILMQECNFDYEIVVGDNGSEDETRSILLAYQEKHPDKFKLLLPSEKLGCMLNFIKTWEECLGKYVALMDGNDYWQDPCKLQKQVGFLEENSKYASCYHDTILINGKDKLISETFERYKNYSEDDQICGMATMQFSTRMMRNMEIDLPEYMLDLYQPDTIMGHFSGFYGKAAYLDEIDKNVYRVLDSNSANINKKLDSLKSNIKTREMIIKHLETDSRRMKIVENHITDIYLDKAYVTLRDEGMSAYFSVWQEIFSNERVSRYKMMALHLKDIVVKVMYKIKKRIL